MKFLKHIKMKENINNMWVYQQLLEMSEKYY